MPDLIDAGEAFVNLDTGEKFAELGVPALAANAYLGGTGITAALAAGADVVVCGRVTDAAVVIGPAAWWHGWDYEHDLDALAGALVAGHVIECGAQATGGNYSFFTDVPGLEHPGFPIGRDRRRRDQRHHQARRDRGPRQRRNGDRPTAVRGRVAVLRQPGCRRRLRHHRRSRRWAATGCASAERAGSRRRSG